MRTISSFEEAKAVLSHPRFQPGELPCQVSQKIQEVFGKAITAEEAVARIIADVQSRGDAAVLDYSQRLDGVKPASLRVSREEIQAAFKKADPSLVSALRTAAEQVRSFHQMQMRYGPKEFAMSGLQQMIHPIERVGIYVPGGTACYPSTVLMSAIPARVAGVQEVVLATPPKTDGEVPAATLVAAEIASVDAVFKVGGAQAVAALAFGTQSIPKVDKICGPGGLFVVLAKKAVFGIVDIDGLAGPTETIVVADDSADPALCAADLLAQAEHDVLASVILITTSAKLARATSQELERQLRRLDRAAIARQSLDRAGLVLIVADMDQAVELVNLYAPEHLSLMTRDASSYATKIRNAAGIFIGDASPETLGDYVAGPSHIMPTGGTARFRSPLGISDFLKVTTIVSFEKSNLEQLGPAAAIIARAEGFTAHAHAVEMRLGRGADNEPVSHDN